MEKTICELFAGVGGFRLGFEHQSKSWKTVWFSQWEPNASRQWAHDCYVKHFGDIDSNTGIDISQVDKKLIPNHNLLVGGFPCQDYSVAHSLSSSHGIEGKKGVLWWDIRDTLIAKSTPFVLLENVDRLLKSPANQRGRDFSIILSCFADLGYSVEWRVINASEYGAGQRRKRTFIFAFKNSTNYAKSLKKIDCEDYVISKGILAKSFPISENGSFSTCEIDYSDIEQISKSFKFNYLNAGYMTNGKVYTCDVKPAYESPIVLLDLVQHNVQDKYFITNNLEKWEYLKGSKKIERKSKSGYSYTFSEGPIAFPDPLNKPARTMLTSEATLNRSTHVIKDIDNNKLRLLTPIEAERIQGFDDDWTNTGMPERMRYFCMGNALVVPMITRMAKYIEEIFDKE